MRIIKFNFRIEAHMKIKVNKGSCSSPNNHWGACNTNKSTYWTNITPDWWEYMYCTFKKYFLKQLLGLVIPHIFWFSRFSGIISCTDDNSNGRKHSSHFVVLSSIVDNLICSLCCIFLFLNFYCTDSILTASLNVPFFLCFSTIAH